MSEQPKKGKRILYRLLKGFLYGNVIGLFAGSAIYILATAVNTIAVLPVPPASFFALIYGSTVAIGVASEYSSWLEEQQ